MDYADIWNYSFWLPASLHRHQQAFLLTGGSISLETGFQQLRQFGTDGYRSFVVVPALLMLSQPVFGYNRFKWLRKIEPLKFQEAERQLGTNIEQIALKVVSHYFNLLLCEINAKKGNSD
jgi:hypothetical protein